MIGDFLPAFIALLSLATAIVLALYLVYRAEQRCRCPYCDEPNDKHPPGPCC